VSNSNFLNKDVGITRLVIPNFGNQIIMPSLLIYLLLYFLVQLCFRIISYDVLYCCDRTPSKMRGPSSKIRIG
jgi:hypothetical protein